MRNNPISIPDYISIEGSLIEGLFTYTQQFSWTPGFLGYHGSEERKTYFIIFSIERCDQHFLGSINRSCYIKILISDPIMCLMW